MNNEKLEPKNEGFPGSDKPCLCNEKARLMTGSVPLSIFSSKITVHHVPYYFCDHCKRTYFDSVTEIDVVLKRAYQLGLSEIDYVAGLSQFIYKIELLHELKLSFEQVLLINSRDIAPGEEFAVVHNNQVVVGYREEDCFVIENVIDKVI
ncbi:hypothetical protein [Paenibacillus sp. FSL L8-0709]|uniref:hypothetical protein n=1 Tax=Paenibacillus sp. FSL L8-0709 TaxID=2975312 RepID=UPI0030FD0940